MSTEQVERLVAKYHEGFNSVPPSDVEIVESTREAETYTFLSEPLRNKQCEARIQVSINDLNEGKVDLYLFAAYHLGEMVAYEPTARVEEEIAEGGRDGMRPFVQMREKPVLIVGEEGDYVNLTVGTRYVIGWCPESISSAAACQIQPEQQVAVEA